MKFLSCLILLLPALAVAAPPDDTPDLPPRAVVASVLAGHPDVLAAKSGVRYEESNRSRLEAGEHEFSVSVGSARRRTDTSRSLNEWDVAVERPIRLPGKARLDGELGELGVAQAQSSLGDAMHETARGLLRAWFGWLKARAQSDEWNNQVSLLRRQSEVAARRVRAGDAPRLEQTLAEASTAQAEAAAVQAELRASVAAAELTQHYPGISLPERPVLATPTPVDQPHAYWHERILQHNHELAAVRAEVKRRQTLIARSQAEELPDPTVGVRHASEAGGNERVTGLYVSIPLPGRARTASTEGARAQMDMAVQKEAALLRRLNAEISAAHAGATAAYEGWRKAQAAAQAMERNAELIARAYALGEAGLNDTLNARRLAVEGKLASATAQLDAAEARYRLLLDAHQLWLHD
ncbi:MAG: TolC family protein [Denitratisoma sp.]|nr:TolC family protein [Denitratisoma sp.]